MKKNEIKVKKSLKSVDANAILEDLVKSFRQGTVCIESNDVFIVLKPSEQISLKIEAEQKKNKEKLVIEMSWEQVAEKEEKEVETFKISDKEPEPVVEEATESVQSETEYEASY